MSNSFEKQVVIVTGGTKGLGRALCLRYGRAGYFVAAVYHSDTQAAAALENDFKTLGVQGCVLRHDITSSHFPVDAIPAAESITLINNAFANFEPGPFHLTEWRVFQEQLDVTLKGSYNAVRSLLKTMLGAKQSTLINVLSYLVYTTPPPKGFTPYIAAKYALLGFSRAIASEYGQRGIRVFSVSPGLMNTPSTLKWNEHLRKAIIDKTCGILEPEAVADKIFALQENSTTTGNGEDYTIPNA